MMCPAPPEGLRAAVPAGSSRQSQERCVVAEPEGGSSAQAERIAGLDTSVAHPARVYDYWLGGRFL